MRLSKSRTDTNLEDKIDCMGARLWYPELTRSKLLLVLSDRQVHRCVILVLFVCLNVEQFVAFKYYH